MTSFIIGDHTERAIAPSWQLEFDCVFCQIIERKQHAFIVFENEQVIAIVGEAPRTSSRGAYGRNEDTLPIRPGHLLVIPKGHFSRLSELPVELGAAVGAALPVVSAALTKGERAL